MASLQVAALLYDSTSETLSVVMTDGTRRIHSKVRVPEALALSRTKRKHGGYAGYPSFSRRHPHRVLK